MLATIYSADPMFVGAPNYHLQAGSPCIDAGFNAPDLPARDIDGDARIIGPTVDMGVDEALTG